MSRVAHVISVIDRSNSKNDAKPKQGLSSSLSVFPVALFAVLAYVTCSTSITLANKFIFSNKDLNYPWMLLSTQSFVVIILLLTYLVLNGKPPFNFTLFKQMLVPCVMFTLFIFTNAAALRLVSLPILSVLKSLAPMGIGLAERLIFGDRISTGTAFAMFLIVVGNLVTVLTDAEFSSSGYSWAISNVLINIVYVVSLRLCLSNSYTPIEKALHSNMIAFSFMILAAVANAEVLPFLEALKVAPPMFRAILFLSCFLCAGIGASIFWLIQTTSGSTLSFVGSCNKFTVVIFGGLLFKTNITPPGWISIFFGVIAGVVFAIAKASAAQNREVSGSGQSPGITFHVHDKDNEGDDGDGNNGHDGDGDDQVVKSLLEDGSERLRDERSMQDRDDAPSHSGKSK